MSDLNTEVQRLLSNDAEFRALLAAAGIKKWAGPGVNYPALLNPDMLREPEAALDLRNRVEKALTKGEPIPVDVATGVVEARAHDDALRARADAILAVLVSYEPLPVQRDDETIEPALELLRRELGAVIARARELHAQLQGATSAEQILEAPVEAVHAWRELRGLVDRYDEIRTVHLGIFRQAWVNESTSETFTRGTFDRVGVFADFIDLHGHWTDLRREAGANSDPGKFRDWLKLYTSPKIAGLADLEAPYRLALIATATRPWLPNVSTFRLARAAAERALVAVDSYNLKQAETARAELFAITGMPDEPPVTGKPGRKRAGNGRPQIPSKFRPESAWAAQQREQMAPSTWGAEQPL